MFFSHNTRIRIFIILSRKARFFFLQYSTLDYMTKSLNRIIFLFPPPKSEFFFSNIGNQNIFLEKNHTPPLQVKWSFPKKMSNTDPKKNRGWTQMLAKGKQSLLLIILHVIFLCIITQLIIHYHILVMIKIPLIECFNWNQTKVNTD